MGSTTLYNFCLYFMLLQRQELLERMLFLAIGSVDNYSERISFLLPPPLYGLAASFYVVRLGN